MMTPDRRLEGDWHPGVVPENALLEEEAYLETTYSFSLFRSQAPEAVFIGRGASVYLGTMFDMGPRARVRIGRFSLLNGARLICDHNIEIGDFCLISWNVVIMDSERWSQNLLDRRRELVRVPEREDRHVESQTEGEPVRVGPNVWIGFDSCVLPGVAIGEGSVVGARSVVREDVPPNTVVVGNPARPVRDLEPAGPLPPDVQALVS